MADELLLHLLRATLAVSAGILLVILLRIPLRHAFGARAAYWAWLLVPLSLVATFVPRQGSAWSSAVATAAPVALTGWSLPADATAVAAGGLPAIALPGIWLAGAVFMMMLFVRRQQRFVRSLAATSSPLDGSLRSATVSAPLVTGAWRPRIVVPADFEQRYDEQQRHLMLAHEQTHLSRQDTRIAALGGLLVCLFWFNPLLYWAMRLLRLDQEMACDAATVAGTGVSRRAYAETLLSTPRIAGQIGLALPAGCHWKSSHPLNTRIAMLKKPLPGPARLIAGISASLTLAAIGSVAVWAAQPATSVDADNGPVVLSLKWLVEGDKSDPERSQRMDEPNRLVRADETLTSTSPDGRYSVACKARRLPAGAPGGEVLLECSISEDGKVIATPAVTTIEGYLPSFDRRDRETGRRIYVVLNASTSADRIRLAQQKTNTP